MNKRIILCSLAALILLIAAALWFFTNTAGDAQDPDADESVRNIYIGDIITLKVASRTYSAEELTSIFHGFEIVDIQNEPEGFILSLRTFTVGEHKVFLGNKEIVINVSSTLDDIERDEIFQGDTWVIKPGFMLYWQIILLAAAGAFVLSGGFVLAKVIKKRKENALSPLQLFIKRCAALSPDDDYNNNYFVDLTFYFKEYLGSRFKCRIIGKTSIEIINELNKIRATRNIQAIDAFLYEIQEWLTECDRLKFSGVEVSVEEKKAHFAILYNLVEKIDQTKEEAA